LTRAAVQPYQLDCAIDLVVLADDLETHLVRDALAQLDRVLLLAGAERPQESSYVDDRQVTVSRSAECVNDLSDAPSMQERFDLFHVSS
jgi:hypothetical protein